MTSIVKREFEQSIFVESFSKIFTFYRSYSTRPPLDMKGEKQNSERCMKIPLDTFFAAWSSRKLSCSKRERAS